MVATLSPASELSPLGAKLQILKEDHFWTHSGITSESSPQWSVPFVPGWICINVVAK